MAHALELTEEIEPAPAPSLGPPAGQTRASTGISSRQVCRPDAGRLPGTGERGPDGPGIFVRLGAQVALPAHLGRLRPAGGMAQPRDRVLSASARGAGDPAPAPDQLPQSAFGFSLSSSYEGSVTSVVGRETARCQDLYVGRSRTGRSAGTPVEIQASGFRFTLLQANGAVIAKSRSMPQRRSPRNEFQRGPRDAGVSTLVLKKNARGAFGLSPSLPGFGYGSGETYPHEEAGKCLGEMLTIGRKKLGTVFVPCFEQRLKDLAGESEDLVKIGHTMLDGEVPNVIRVEETQVPDRPFTDVVAIALPRFRGRILALALLGRFPGRLVG